jgi:4-aminobutyrate aminotransferase
LGARLQAELEVLRPRVPQIAEVRGLGAMVAVEFRHAGTAEPDADFTKRVQAGALQRGLILLTCGVNANVVRFMFPLTTPDAVFDDALGILRDAIIAAG